MYARAASSPELGYLVAQAIVKGSVPIEKPTLPEHGQASGSPPVKETRAVWWTDGFVDTDIYEMTDVRNGPRSKARPCSRPSPPRSPIPPDRRAWLDEHGIFHLENKEA